MLNELKSKLLHFNDASALAQANKGFRHFNAEC